MVTRLYLRNASSTVTGTLPSAEQSTLTADDFFDTTNTDTLNKQLSRTKGSSAQNFQNASIATTSQQNYYVARFVSEPLTQTSVAANTWTYGFASRASDGNAKFPPAGTIPVYVNCYVWKPSNGTKYGTVLDGNTSNCAGTSSGTVTNAQANIVTFTGSAVSSLTSGDAVLVFEVWFRITQTLANSYTQNFQYDGPNDTYVSLDTGLTNCAAYIQTPENLSIDDGLVTTKLYLHATTSGLPSGTLPSAEQSTSTVTSGCNFEGSQTTNRLMNTTIGTSQATLTLNTPANTSANNYYVSRWVSPVIYQTSVNAGTWTYNFAARESATTLNYPVTSSNKAVWVNCYVWKPSNGTKYGTILDGNTAATVTEGTTNQERSQQADFTGASVSSLTSGDACIVFEVWFLAVTGSSGISAVADFMYDGTTETAAGSTVSNHASLISYFGVPIQFTAGGTNYPRTITESGISVGAGTLSRSEGAIRAISESSITIGSGSVSRIKGNVRAISEGAITVGAGSVFRVKNAIRSITGGAVTVGAGSVSRIKNAVRTISETSISVGSGTISRIKNAIRTISEPSTSVGSGTVTRVATNTRIISQSSISVGSGTVTRVYNAIRSIPQSITVGTGTVSRIKNSPRTIVGGAVTVNSGSVSRVVSLSRIIPSSVSVGAGILTRIVTNSRTIIQSVSVGAGSVVGIIVTLRNITTGAVSVGSGTVSRVVQNSRFISQATINVSGGVLSRSYNAIRSISSSVSVAAGTVARSVQYTRTITQSSISVGSGSLSRIKNAFRTIPQSISVGGGILSRSVQYHRTILQSTISITDQLTAGIVTLRIITENIISVGAGSVTRTVSNNRTITQSISVGAGVCNRVVSLSRTCIGGTVIVGSGIVSRAKATSRQITEPSITVGAGIVTRIRHISRSILEPTIILSDAVVRSLSNSRVINETVNVGSGIVNRFVSYGRTIIESTISIADSISISIVSFVVLDYVPKLLHDFTEDIGKMVMDWLKSKYDIGDPNK